MRFRFTIRDLLWLTLVVALMLALYLERRSQVNGIEIQERQSKQIDHLLDQVKYLTNSNRSLATQRDGEYHANEEYRREIQKFKKEQASQSK